MSDGEETQHGPMRRRSSSRLSLSADDIEDGSDSSYDEATEEQRIDILHQLQVQSARKFLWDEDNDESDDDVAPLGIGAGNLKNHGSSSRFVLPAVKGSSFVWNSQEEIDLEGHLGATRYDIVETKSRSRFLDRFLVRSRDKSDRLGFHSAYGKKSRKNGSCGGLCQNLCLYIQGFFLFISGCLFGARNTKRNVLCFLLLAGIITGIFFAVTTGDNDDAPYLWEPLTTDSPTAGSIPEPILVLPIPPAPTETPKKPTEHFVVGISDGEAVVNVSESEFNDDSHVASFEALLKEEGFYDAELFKDESTPQYKALHWIAKVDPARMRPTTETFVLQRYALATVFFALSGADLVRPGQQEPQTKWANQARWMTGAGFCAWHGVTCITGDDSFANSQVISLNLTANGLEGQLPPEVHILSSLDHLDLSQNAITGAIPVELSSMSRLRTLFLQENKLTGSIPSEIGHLLSLQYLDLSENDLNGQIPSEIGDCKSMRALVIDMNTRIKGHIPILSSMSNLEVLSLKHNTLDGTIPDWLYDLTSLKQLRFQRTALSGTVSTSLANLSNLRYLQLSQNALTGEFPDVLGYLRHLLVLDLVVNQFEGEFPPSITKLPHLERLLLEGNKFSGEIPSTIGHLRTLRDLYIGKNEFSSTIPDVFQSMSNLELFHANNNSLTGGIPQSLGSCSNLLNLKVEGNQLSAPIPPSLGILSNLEVFNLNDNNFTGEMPGEVCALHHGTGNLQYIVADCQGEGFECSCCTKCM